MAKGTHRIIFNAILTLLIQTHMPPMFWVEALYIIVHVINHIMCAFFYLKSLFELIFQKTPTISCLCVFSYECYPLSLIPSAYKL